MNMSVYDVADLVNRVCTAELGAHETIIGDAKLTSRLHSVIKSFLGSIDCDPSDIYGLLRHGNRFKHGQRIIGANQAVGFLEKDPLNRRWKYRTTVQGELLVLPRDVVLLEDIGLIASETSPCGFKQLGKRCTTEDVARVFCSKQPPIRGVVMHPAMDVDWTKCFELLPSTVHTLHIVRDMNTPTEDQLVAPLGSLRHYHFWETETNPSVKEPVGAIQFHGDYSSIRRLKLEKAAIRVTRDLVPCQRVPMDRFFNDHVPCFLSLLKACPHLQDLELCEDSSYRNLSIEDIIATIVKHCPRLQRLKLINFASEKRLSSTTYIPGHREAFCARTSRCIHPMERLEHLRSLKVLELVNCDMTGEEEAQLFRFLPRKLGSLKLAVESVCAEWLDTWRTPLPRLRFLRIHSNRPVLYHLVNDKLVELARRYPSLECCEFDGFPLSRTLDVMEAIKARVQHFFIHGGGRPMQSPFVRDYPWSRITSFTLVDYPWEHEQDVRGFVNALLLVPSRLQVIEMSFCTMGGFTPLLVEMLIGEQRDLRKVVFKYNMQYAFDFVSVLARMMTKGEYGPHPRLEHLEVDVFERSDPGWTTSVVHFMVLVEALKPTLRVLKLWDRLNFHQDDIDAKSIRTLLSVMLRSCFPQLTYVSLPAYVLAHSEVIHGELASNRVVPSNLTSRHFARAHQAFPRTSHLHALAIPRTLKRVQAPIGRLPVELLHAVGEILGSTGD